MVWETTALRTVSAGPSCQSFPYTAHYRMSDYDQRALFTTISADDSFIGDQSLRNALGSIHLH